MLSHARLPHSLEPVVGSTRALAAMDSSGLLAVVAGGYCCVRLLHWLYSASMGMGTGTDAVPGPGPR